MQSDRQDLQQIYLPITFGSESKNIALGTNLLFSTFSKKLSKVKSSLSPKKVEKPSGSMQCSSRNNSKNAVPI